MADFLITGPDGGKYRVSGENEQGAYDALITMLGQGEGGAPQPSAPQGRTLGQTIYENVIGSGEADTPGEQLGQLINQAGSGALQGAAGLIDLVGTWGAPVPEVEMGQDESGRPAPQFTGLSPNAPTSEAVAPMLRQPETTAQEYANTVGSFLPGALAGGGGLSGLLQYGVVPGLASEAAGQVTEGSDYEGLARGAAAIASPFAAAGLARASARAVTPNPADPARIQLAENLRREGLPVTAGQRTGSERLRRIEGMTGRGQAISGDQAELFTASAMSRIGSTAKRASPEALSEAATRIGGVMDDAVRGVNVIPDRNVVTRIAQANNTYRQLAPKATQAPIVGNVLREVAGAYRTGRPIPASTISSWRSNLSKLTRSSDAATRSAAIEAMDAVDDALASSLSAAGRPEAVQQLATARAQYRDLLAIQNAAARAGEGAAVGVISPSALRNELVRQNRAAFAQGRRGDLADLSRSAEGVMKPLPTSGTAENIRALGVPTVASGGLGAMLAHNMGLPAEVGALAGAAAPGMARGAMMTPPMQAYLGNQLLPMAGPTVDRARLLGPLASMMGAQ